MQLSATAFRGSAVAESGIKEIRAYVAARGEQKARGNGHLRQSGHVANLEGYKAAAALPAFQGQ